MSLSGSSHVHGKGLSESKQASRQCISYCYYGSGTETAAVAMATFTHSNITDNIETSTDAHVQLNGI